MGWTEPSSIWFRLGTKWWGGWGALHFVPKINSLRGVGTILHGAFLENEVMLGCITISGLERGVHAVLGAEN